MRSKTLFILFIISSIVFLSISLLLLIKPLHLKKVEIRRVANIQKTYYKNYLKRRDRHTPLRHAKSAQKKIEKLLALHPIYFDLNSSLLEYKLSKMERNKNYVALAQIIEVLNNLNEKIILKIKTHTTKTGSKKHNLKLSQQRADKIKDYIQKRSNIIFISSIGYGKEITLIKSKKKLKQEPLTLHLQRIK
jgi:outer membrane protein OmpA-like peptidoglycan-associated protein